MDIHATVSLHTGRKMPVLGLGTWKLTHQTATIIAQALRVGYPMIDTSGDYGTQPGIAEGIKQSGVARDSFFIVTKVEETDEAYEATRKNLAELQLTYADLVLIHRPPKDGADKPLWEGLIKARDEGLTRDIGVSNYSEVQIQALIDATGETPAVNQIEWSPFGWSQEMLDFCKTKGIVVQAWSPLTRSKRLEHETLTSVAAKHKKSPAQILIRWDLQKGVVPLPKANQPEHLAENLDVFDFELSAKEMEALDSLNEEYSTLGPKPEYRQ
ncbi:MAG TPA: aldo/keto reductase [Patescibacteria group bacterium]|nr:aldo/keto reductase [Patescibacteria group bacterium]